MTRRVVSMSVLAWIAMATHGLAAAPDSASPPPSKAPSSAKPDLDAKPAAAKPSLAKPTTQANEVHENPARPVLAAMREAEKKLSARDLGQSTRKAQQRAVDEIQKLIDRAQQQQGQDGAPPPPSSGQPPQNPGSQQPQRKPEGDPSSPKDKNEDAKPQQSSAQQSGAGKPATRQTPVKTGETAVARNSDLVRDVWGHLPPAIRQQFRAEFGETALPAYDGLIRRYFEALVEQGATEEKPARSKSLR